MNRDERNRHRQSRRIFLRAGAGLALGGALALAPAKARPEGILTRPIPATGERIPIVGLGTWITFDVGGNRAGRARCTDILDAFFRRGGGMIDSSPMYGSAQDVIGHSLARVGDSRGLFSATSPARTSPHTASY